MSRSIESKLAAVKAIATQIPRHSDGTLSIDAVACMLELRAILTPRPPQILVDEVAKLGLISSLLECLKFRLELDEEEDGLTTARALIALLGSILATVNQDAIPQTAIVNALLSFASRVHDALGNMEGIERVENAEETVEFAVGTLSRIVRDRPSCCTGIMTNGNLLPLLMSDTTKVTTAVLTTLRDVLINAKRTFLETDASILLEIAEECCYVLVEGDSAINAELALKVVLPVLYKHPHMVQNLSEFRRLSTAIYERWKTYEHVVSDVERLVAVFDENDRTERRRLQQLEEQRAAVCIQAAFKGHLLRRRMGRLPTAVLALQSHWRRRCAVRTVQTLRAQRRDELARLQRTQHLDQRIAVREARLHALRDVPAGKVSAYVAAQRLQATRLLQRWWRGHRVRRQFRGLVRYITRHRPTASPISAAPPPAWIQSVLTAREQRRDAAARTIQRAYRQFRQRRAETRDGVVPGRNEEIVPIPGLTEARRVELQDEVRRRWPISDLFTRPTTLEETQALYAAAQRQYRVHREHTLDHTRASIRCRGRVQTIHGMVKALQHDLSCDLDTLVSRHVASSSNATRSDDRSTAAVGVAQGRQRKDPTIATEALARHRAMLARLPTHHGSVGAQMPVYPSAGDDDPVPRHMHLLENGGLLRRQSDSKHRAS
eukprot:m.386338 g.386338  ORF g.386338 m.386338 type:complete len:662 (-) comp21014_c1_seq2:1390-3375(-)